MENALEKNVGPNYYLLDQKMKMKMNYVQKNPCNHDFLNLRHHILYFLPRFVV